MNCGLTNSESLAFDRGVRRMPEIILAELTDAVIGFRADLKLQAGIKELAQKPTEGNSPKSKEEKFVMEIINHSWLPTYSEFQDKAKQGLVTLNPTSDQHKWLTENVQTVGKRYFFFNEPHYLVRVLNAMIHKDFLFDAVMNKRVDLILHSKPQEYVLEAFENLSKYR